MSERIRQWMTLCAMTILFWVYWKPCSSRQSWPPLITLLSEHFSPYHSIHQILLPSTSFLYKSVTRLVTSNAHLCVPYSVQHLKDGSNQLALSWWIISTSSTGDSIIILSGQFQWTDQFKMGEILIDVHFEHLHHVVRFCGGYRRNIRHAADP